ncbi:MAG: four helix bundle protein [Planctomycetales bacterium]
MPVQNFRELIVWQKAMDFVTDVYRATADFPRDERFGLTQQLRGAAVSIPSNVSEGQGRGSTADFLRFLNIARGSLNESQTQLLLAYRLGFLPEQWLSRLMDCSEEIARLLNGLMRALNAKNTP